MNDKKNFLIMLGIMVVLIGGADLLYDTLGDKLESPGLVVQSGSTGQTQGSDMLAMGAQSAEDVATSSGAQSGGMSTASTGNQADTVSGSSNAQSDKNGSAQDSTETNQGDEEREPAPDFTVYDEAGNPYKLSDFRGKPVIVNFWASWCGPCKSEMPDFQELYEVYGEEIHFLMVNMTDGAQETVDSASKFIADSAYSFPVYYDTTMEAAMTYGVYSIPTTFFFDAEGYGVAYGSGAMDKGTLQTGIDMIYSGNE